MVCAQTDSSYIEYSYIDSNGRITPDTSASIVVFTSQKLMAYYQSDFHLPHPPTAVKLNLLIPGAGQVYNKQAWKLPALYGGFGFALFNLGQSRNRYRQFKIAYEKDIAGEERGFPGLTRGTLKLYRDQFRRRLEINYLGIGGVYIIGILDAFVSAHLASFDISEDLSIDIPPPNGLSGIGLSITYSF